LNRAAIRKRMKLLGKANTDHDPPQRIMVWPPRARDPGRGVKVVHLSTTDSGGAAGAARRLHQALRAEGVESRLLVAVRRSDDPAAELPGRLRDRLWAPAWQRINGLALRLAAGAPSPLFSPGLATHGGLDRHPAVQAADVVCLYWVAGMLSPRAIAALPRPIVWRLSDEWPYTGGCHYAGDCAGFRAECGRCPVLGSGRRHDLAWHGQQRRLAAFAGRRITVVAPSRWIAARAKASRALGHARVVHVATGVDTAVFAPSSRAAARQRLGLPAAGPIVAFGAAGGIGDPRKGFDLLRAAIATLGGQAPLLLLFGTDRVPDGVDARTVGALSAPAALAGLFVAADAVAVPSRADNLPQVALEALACGTPVVGFDVGGLADAVRHGVTGWLARPFDVADLAAGLRWATGAGAAVRAAARAHAVAAFDLRTQARHYLDVLREAAAEGR
jgi:glycosyltransferase involved in cell wall biosynthesis